jgi:PKD repeat protein
VQFTNGTSGASTYSWDFGDGTSSTAASPVHVYTSPGSYSVYLSAVSALGCTSQSLPGSIVSVYISPVVQVACSDTLICAGDCISFSDQSTGAPIQWQWSFSGAVPGTSGVSNVGQVCYNTPGDYDVTLTAGNNACSASRTFTDFVHVTDCSLAPVAAFVCSDSSFCVNGCTSFLSLAQNATGWNWSFPGATPSFSTAANPSGICYPAVGDYPVILQVTNPAGSDQITVTNLIHIASVPPIPSFIQSGDTLLAPQGYAGYQWYYNGSLIVGSNSYRYLALQSGNYSVAVTNSSGCRAISQPQHVSLVGLDELIADFNLRIYPVPFNDQLIIRYYGQQPVSCFILLTDALGRTVIIHDFKFNTRTAEHTIDTGNLPAGTYVLVISDNIRRVVRKLIKM